MSNSLRRRSRPRSPICARALGIAQQLGDRFRQGGRVLRLDQQARERRPRSGQGRRRRWLRRRARRLHVLHHGERAALEVRGADSHVERARTSGTSLRWPRNMTVSSRPELRRPGPRARSRRSPSPAISTRRPGNSWHQDRRRPQQHVERLLRPQQADRSDHRRVRRDAQLGAHVVAAGGRRRRDAVRDEHRVLGRILSTSIIRRWSSRETATNVGEPRAMTLAVGEAAQRLALIGPGVLVRDDHRNPRQRPEHGAPEVRAELVRVKHVDALAPQQPVQRPPGPDLPRRARVQADDPTPACARSSSAPHVLLGDGPPQSAAGAVACGRSARGRARWSTGWRDARRRRGPEPVDQRHDPPPCLARRAWTCGEYHRPDRPAAEPSSDEHPEPQKPAPGRSRSEDPASSSAPDPSTCPTAPTSAARRAARLLHRLPQQGDGSHPSLLRLPRGAALRAAHQWGLGA